LYLFSHVHQRLAASGWRESRAFVPL
jgi:hypothetical protein